MEKKQDSLPSSDRSVGSDGSDGSNIEQTSGGSDAARETARRPRQGLRPSGGYRSLRSFGAASIIYDATVVFCHRFLDKRSRTVDQMVQAARSGRQNLVEGSHASSASSQTELRLVTVARASLDELLLDYEDFLRQRGLALWAKDDARALAVRAVGRTLKEHRTDDTTTDLEHYATWLKSEEPEVVANAILCLIHQANYLTDRQLSGLEQSFIEEGGFSEKLAEARRMERLKKPEDGEAPQVSYPAPSAAKPWS